MCVEFVCMACLWFVLAMPGRLMFVCVCSFYLVSGVYIEMCLHFC